MLLKGMAVGLAIAAPVGPIGLLCIRRSLAEGRSAGLATGLGAATADAVYGAIAAFGLTAVSAVLIAQQFWLRLAGGVFLFYLGVRIALAAPATATDQPAPTGLLSAYASTALLTLANPLTILSFAAVFAGLGVSASGGTGAAVSVVSGVFLGSALWWLLLSGAASLLRARIDVHGLRWLNRLSGAILLAFACYILAGIHST
jgi:threonine/homoserine/homoserine lactone efflux protein